MKEALDVNPRRILFEKEGMTSWRKVMDG